MRRETCSPHALTVGPCAAHFPNPYIPCAAGCRFDSGTGTKILTPKKREMEKQENRDQVLKELNGLVRPYETQAEYEDAMRRLNDAQSEMCMPLTRKMAEVNLEQAKLRTELQRLQLQRTELSQAWHGMDMERKAVCETFYEMKHRLIVQNPRIVPEPKKTIG